MHVKLKPMQENKIIISSAQHNREKNLITLQIDDSNPLWRPGQTKLKDWIK